MVRCGRRRLTAADRPPASVTGLARRPALLERAQAGFPGLRRRLRAPATSAVLLLVSFLLLPPAFACPARAQSPDSLAASPAPADIAAPPRLATLPVVGDLVLAGRAAAHAATAPLRWGRGDLGTLGLAAGSLALVSVLDATGREVMEESRSEAGDRAEEAVEPFGRMRGAQVVGALYAAGVVLDDDRLRAVAAEAVASGVVAAGIFQPALAGATGRSRPRSGRSVRSFAPFSGSISFPSGHTTAAFSVASVIAAEYPHPAVRVAAYGLASAVGVARMYAGAHFLSDVVAAAMLGTAVGRGVARFGAGYRERLRIVPAAGGWGGVPRPGAPPLSVAEPLRTAPASDGVDDATEPTL